MPGSSNLARRDLERLEFPPEDLPRDVPVAVEICSAEGKPKAQRQNGSRRPFSQATASRIEGPGGSIPPWLLCASFLSARGTREAGKDSLDSLRGTKEAGKDQLDSLRGTREVGKSQLDSLGGTREAPRRQERINWTACEAPGRHQGGRKEQFAPPGKHWGGTRETRRTSLPIESRFWRGAGFCITVNTISMANGPVRGKSWGGLHGWLPVAQTGL